MKKETLEEAAERLIFKTIGGNYGIMSSDENDQVDGYYNTYEEAYLTLKLKWQAERMYSEEDIQKAFKAGFSNGFASDILSTEKLQKEKERLFCEWFEQFKKK